MRSQALILGSVLWLVAGCATRIEPTRHPPVEGASRCVPASGAHGPAALRTSADHARALLEDAIATLDNERPGSRRQFIDLVESPIQRLPRLTTPFIGDPATLASRGGRQTPAWFVPLVLDPEQLGGVTGAHLTGELSFWLAPHGRGVAHDDWRPITGCLVREPGRPTALVTSGEAREAGADAADADGSPVARAPESLGVVFELPAQGARAGSGVPPGFYDLKVLPRLNVLRGVPVETAVLGRFAEALTAGDWPAARQTVAGVEPEELAGSAAARDLRRIAAAIEPAPSPWSVIQHPSPNFHDDLRALRKAIAALARELERMRADRAEVRLLQLAQVIRRTLESPRSLAPVALEDPAEDRARCGGRACIRIAVGGDFQFHGDSSAVLSFLGALDPSIRPGADDEPAAASEPVHDVDFVLFAGDLADAAAGSAKDELVLNVLGVLPVTSPYGHGGGGEMLTLRSHLARFRRPFFAVPGNHDGYAGFGGILNVPFDELGELTQAGVGLASPRLGRSWGNGVRSLNDFIPSLVGWRVLTRHPRWDGLVEFQNILGSLNLAFTFRGHSFVGLNTYDLEPKERASVGGVVLYYGGGLQDGTVAWVEDMLSRFAPEEGRQQILFMHHDPRAATPGKASYRQQNYGRYDAIDTPVSYLTFGHLGLGNSPQTGLYLPLVSYLGTALVHTFDVSWGADVGGSHQVWMRKPDWAFSSLPDLWWPRFYDRSSYNARGLIEVINCNLASRERTWKPTPTGDEERCVEPRGRISQLLFAHDNIPLADSWADPDERGAVFRQPNDAQPWRGPGWENSLNSQLMSGLLGGKTRSGSPSKWAQDMRIAPDQGNAAVLRMDDVGDVGSIGNYHGFHVLTLYEDGEREMEWVPLAR